MSIPEAAQLVIQAGTMASGGEVFVLDMGTPVKIDDLARTMIRLSGLEVRDDSHPDGDIAIEYVGLRRGEKLYEELLIGENTTGTSHPRIFKNSEPILAYEDLAAALERLDDAIQKQDEAELQDMLRATVEGYVAGQHRRIRLRQGRMAARLAHAALRRWPLTWLCAWAAVVVAAAALTAGADPRLEAASSSAISWRSPMRARRIEIATPQGAGLAVMLALCSWSAPRPCCCRVAARRRSEPRPRACRRALRSPCSARSTTPTRSPCHVALHRPDRLPPSPWWLSLPEDLRLLPGSLAAHGRAGAARARHGRLRQRRQLSRRTRLDDGGGGRAHRRSASPCCRPSAPCLAGIGLLALALLGAMLGFAMFNKHPAQIFLGDAGSLPIGLLPRLHADLVAKVNLAAALLLPLYIVADTGHHAAPPR